MARGQKNPTTIEKQLNNSMPAAANAALGSVLRDLVAKHNALLAKLDADAGVTDTNYVATLRVIPPEEYA